MNQRGAMYVEVIAAVAMVGFAVLASTALTAAHPVASARLAAQEEMVLAMDGVLESVRAGMVPLRSGTVSSPIPTKTRVRLRLETESTRIPGLTRVRVVASATVRGRVLNRSLNTAVWRPL